LTCTNVCPEGILKDKFKMDMGGKGIIERKWNCTRKGLHRDRSYFAACELRCWRYLQHHLCPILCASNGSTSIRASELLWYHSWCFRKKSRKPFFRHSGESRNPLFSESYKKLGPRFSTGWRLFTSSSFLMGSEFSWKNSISAVGCYLADSKDIWSTFVVIRNRKLRINIPFLRGEGCCCLKQEGVVSYGWPLDLCLNMQS
jgi:hypothetical protein